MLEKKLIYRYTLLNSKFITLSEVLKIINSSYENQKDYFATNAFAELDLDYSKVIHLDQKVPSRANVSPIANSIICSKLAGENKIWYFLQKPPFVISTGFFNFQTPYVDHLLGFLLSHSFKRQKQTLATGTTMIGLTNTTFKKILIKKPVKNSSNLIGISIWQISKQIKLISELIAKTISLLVK